MKHCYVLLLGLTATQLGAAAQTPAAPTQLPAQPTMTEIRRGGRPGPQLSQTGWHFASVPKPEFLDKQPGMIRFRLTVNAVCRLDSVITVASSVSAKQEAACRQALQTMQFATNNPAPSRAAGYYTFNFSGR